MKDWKDEIHHVATKAKILGIKVTGEPFPGGLLATTFGLQDEIEELQSLGYTVRLLPHVVIEVKPPGVG